MEIANSSKLGNEVLTVQVNRQRCQGHARCGAIAPEVFEFDELGYARVSGDSEIPTELYGKARLVEANCPEGAIEILRLRRRPNE